MTEALLIVGIILLVVLIFLVLRIKGVQPRDIETAVSSTWISLGLGEKIGAMNVYAAQIKEDTDSFKRMLLVPADRGGFGERALEGQLVDALPKDKYGIREKILGGKTPDAYIKSDDGRLICVDSKLPLTNYDVMTTSEEGREKSVARKAFVKDVRGHLDKIVNDYVCPEKGSAEFAFAYIRSEPVYYFLVTEEFEMLSEYVNKGIQVVSPLTFGQAIRLIGATAVAMRLSENISNFMRQLQSIGKGFEVIDGEWRTFYETHLTNALKKANDINTAYKNLRYEFDKIKKLPGE